MIALPLALGPDVGAARAEVAALDELEDRRLGREPADVPSHVPAAQRSAEQRLSDGLLAHAVLEVLARLLEIQRLILLDVVPVPGGRCRDDHLPDRSSIADLSAWLLLLRHGLSPPCRQFAPFPLARHQFPSPRMMRAMASAASRPAASRCSAVNAESGRRAAASASMRLCSSRALRPMPLPSYSAPATSDASARADSTLCFG